MQVEVFFTIPDAFGTHHTPVLLGMGWDRLWVWCRHRSNDCSLAHRLPTQAFRPSGWQGYSREKSPPRPKPEQPDDSTIFIFWQGSSPSQHSFTSSGCLSSEKAENVDLGRQEKGFCIRLLHTPENSREMLWYTKNISNHRMEVVSSQCKSSAKGA